MEPIPKSPGADGGTKSEGGKEDEEILGAQVDRSSSPFFSGGTAATSQKKVGSYYAEWVKRASDDITGADLGTKFTYLKYYTV